MPRSTASALTSQLVHLSNGATETAPDRELIDRYRRTTDQAAFSALVQRHGPMVLGVCRRMLRDPHAADDAFQATFLVLSKKLSSVAWHESVAGWLHQVARHVCRKSQSASAKQRIGSLPADAPEPVAPASEPTLSDLKAVLDEELNRLPSNYRDAIVLCHLEGLTTDEAAVRLGCTDGQIRGWLHRGREKLRDRLARRGITLSAMTLALLLTQSGVAAVSSALAALTVQTVRIAANAPLAEAASPVVASLTHGVLQTMFHAKLKFLALVAVLFTGLTTASSVWLTQAGADTPPAVAQNRQPTAQAENPNEPNAKFEAQAGDDNAEQKPKVKIEKLEAIIRTVDTGKGTLVVKPDDQNGDMDIELTKDAVILVAKRKVTLADLKPGMQCFLSFREGERPAFEVSAGWPRLNAKVGSVDAGARKITIQVQAEGGLELDVAMNTLPDVSVTFDELPAGLDDIPAGKSVKIELAADKKTIAGVEIEGDANDLYGAVKSVDATANTVLVRLEISGRRHERKVELAFPVDASAKIRFAGKDVKLADLKERMPIVFRLGEDRRTVRAIWVGEPESEQRNDDDD